eukprot:1425340-Pyramimonas_sp.AAC.1
MGPTGLAGHSISATLRGKKRGGSGWPRGGLSRARDCSRKSRSSRPPRSCCRGITPAIPPMWGQLSSVVSGAFRTVPFVRPAQASSVSLPMPIALSCRGAGGVGA